MSEFEKSSKIAVARRSLMSMVFSGQRTRSRSVPVGIVAVASRCRWVTSDDGTSSADVPCSPPPCTAATSSVCPVERPDGATSDSAITNTTPARPSAFGSTDQSCLARAAGRFHSAVRRSARAKPIWNTTQVMTMTPPTRAMPESGPATWEIPSVANGTPPNGKEKRSASTRVCAAGRAMTRHGPVGAAIAATPCSEAKIRQAAM